MRAGSYISGFAPSYSTGYILYPLTIFNTTTEQRKNENCNQLGLIVAVFLMREKTRIDMGATDHMWVYII